MKIPNYFFLVAIPWVLTFHSCMESCTCSKSSGCAILTATNAISNSVEESKTYCSVDNLYRDKVVQDSSKAFSDRHLSDNTLVVRKDTIYDIAQIKKVRKKRVHHYYNMGYDCTCSK